MSQVTAQLLSADGRSAATVSKPWVTRRRGWVAQYIRQAVLRLHPTIHVIAVDGVAAEGWRVPFGCRLTFQS